MAAVVVRRTLFTYIYIYVVCGPCGARGRNCRIVGRDELIEEFERTAVYTAEFRLIGKES
jgi:hypothetical protein